MIEAAQWCEVAVTRFPSVRDGNRVVDIASSCWHAAPGAYARSVLCLDPSSLLSGGLSCRGDHMCGLTGCIATDDHVECVVGVFGDPSSDIGYHGSETSQFAWLIGKASESLHSDRHIDIPARCGRVSGNALEVVEQRRCVADPWCGTHHRSHGESLRLRAACFLSLPLHRLADRMRGGSLYPHRLVRLRPDGSQ